MMIDHCSRETSRRLSAFGSWVLRSESWSLRLRGGFCEFFGFHVIASVAVFFGVFSDVGSDLHGAEGGAAHGAEVGRFGAFGRECFVVEVDGTGRVETESELVAPAEFEASFRDGVIALLGGGVSFGKVGGVSGDLVGDDSFADVVAVGESKVLFGRDVTKHGATIPTDVGGTDTRGDVIVARSDVGGEWPKSVEGSLVAPIDLLLHVFFDELHGNVAGAFVHDLTALGPGARGEFALDFKFGELGIVIGVGDGTGAKAVADGEAHIIGCADIADVVPMGVEKVLGVVMKRPLCHDGATA